MLLSYLNVCVFVCVCVALVGAVCVCMCVHHSSCVLCSVLLQRSHPVPQRCRDGPGRLPEAASLRHLQQRLYHQTMERRQPPDPVRSQACVHACIHHVRHAVTGEGSTKEKSMNKVHGQSWLPCTCTCSSSFQFKSEWGISSQKGSPFSHYVKNN